MGSISSSCKAASIALRTCDDIDEELVTEDCASLNDTAESDEGRRWGYVATEPERMEDAAELLLLTLERELAKADSFDFGLAGSLIIEV